MSDDVSKASTTHVTSIDFPLQKCTTWCAVGDGHGDLHPEDRSCWSEYQIVPLTRHKPFALVDGTWCTASLNVYLRREPESQEPLIIVHSEETDRELRVTLAEARQLADVLRDLDTASEQATLAATHADKGQIVSARQFYRSRRAFRRKAKDLGMELDRLSVADIMELCRHSNYIPRWRIFGPRTSR